MNKIGIIVNADDFGRHELINGAVREGCQNGLIRSATLMVMGNAFADAVKTAKELPELGVGVHLTVVDGTPILAPKQIPSLIDPKTGRFYADHGAFVKAYAKGKIRMSDLRHEWEAQIEKFLASGLIPTHVDSHQHMHVLPGLIDVALDLCARYMIPAMRIPSIPVDLRQTTLKNLGEQIGRTGLHVLAERARKKAKAFQLVVPDAFGGIVAGRAVDKKTIRQILLSHYQGVTEIMVHPGLDDAILSADAHWDHSFETELAAVTDEGNRSICEALSIHVMNFRDLVEERKQP